MSPLGYTRSFTFDQAGNITREKDSLGRVSSYQWDGLHNMTSATDALGAVTEFTYDPLGRLTSHLTTQESWGRSSTLNDHFARHGSDFAASSADDYAAMASDFLQDVGAKNFPVKIDVDGTIRVYDAATNTIGSYNSSGQTLTFFKPTSPTYWSRQPGTLI